MNLPRRQEPPYILDDRHLISYYDITQCVDGLPINNGRLLPVPWLEEASIRVCVSVTGSL